MDAIGCASQAPGEAVCVPRPCIILLLFGNGIAFRVSLSLVCRFTGALFLSWAFGFEYKSILGSDQMLPSEVSLRFKSFIFRQQLKIFG